MLFRSVSRVGRGPGTGRPVKISGHSSSSMQQILMKSGKLKKLDRFTTVYICPDRSPEERVARKQLVVDLKKAISNSPTQHHFIRGGKVVTVSRDNTGD